MPQSYIKRILDARVYDVARETPVDEEELGAILDHLAAAIDDHPRVRPAVERVLSRWRASVDPALRGIAGDLASRMKK